MRPPAAALRVGTAMASDESAVLTYASYLALDDVHAAFPDPWAVRRRL
jgi:hypothetical protein